MVLRTLHSLLCGAALALLTVASAHAHLQEGAPQAPPPTPVRVAPVREESLAPRKRVFGELRAAHRSSLALLEQGIVQKMLVREGQVVKKGEVLAALDTARINIAMHVHASTIRAAHATLVEQDAVLVRAERELRLLESAQAAGGTNPLEVSDAQSAVSIALAQIELAKANIAVLDATAGLLKTRLADHVLYAPFDGVVTKRHVEVGSWLAEGAAVVELQATDKLEAWFDVPQELYPFVMVQRAYMDAQRELGAMPELAPIERRMMEVSDALDLSLPVSALRVIPAIDSRSRSFAAILDVPNPDATLPAGLALTGFIPTLEPMPRLVVSRDAIMHGDAGPFLFVVRDGLAVVPLQVRIDFPVGEDVAIDASGLRAGEAVVIEGNERLLPMSKVAAVSSTSSPVAAGASK
ncbi:MAG: efflux RND transporter periplasmic adaptor subunit [Planctomycetota bacterium]|nr:MAG: efflux RND transporter periplasmic adaptor subunit [Planctomycetota bacterium]